MINNRIQTEIKTCGWNSDFPEFQSTEPRVIRMSLEQFVRGAEKEQIQAWDDSIPLLQTEVREVLEQDLKAKQYYTILEYQLPLESRRPDVIILFNGPIIIVELKTKDNPSQADLDQVLAYVRDLKYYHRACEHCDIKAVIVPTKGSADIRKEKGVFIVGPAGLDNLLYTLHSSKKSNTPTPAQFLDQSAYRPLPKLVQAARELFEKKDIREIWQARASTDPAVNYITKIAHEAALRNGRHLILVRGIPGSGKTLVGLRMVHAKYLDDLTVPRNGVKPTAPGIFLSGNGPLVQVLQYELKKAGGAGKTFIRSMKDYMDYYVKKTSRIPDQHIIVFDEAQRAFNAGMVAATHKEWDPKWVKSEPELIIELCNRIPQWCVVIALVGSGQEIHKGEEDGIEQWSNAINISGKNDKWSVHLPPLLNQSFKQCLSNIIIEPSLNLDVGIRYHLTTAYSEFIEAILIGNDIQKAKSIANNFNSEDSKGSIRLLITRDFRKAKNYLWDRYSNDINARYGLLASSKDRTLEKDFNIYNSYQSTKRVKLGPWYTESIKSPFSCTQLKEVVTEFGAQGLELDMVLLAWGSDLIRSNDKWSIEYAGGYKKNGIAVKDPFKLRINAYRVLLTRGRDGTIVYIPDIPALNETFSYLVSSGFIQL